LGQRIRYRENAQSESGGRVGRERTTAGNWKNAKALTNSARRKDGLTIDAKKL